jgi:23S rRNA (cytosine1962-C5)-methyltransferase
MKIADSWQDYEILDMTSGEKIERWSKYILRRPDPQIVWRENIKPNIWDKYDAIYHRSNKGGGYWNIKLNYLKDGKLNIKI